jgi:hypothetical protein
MAPLRHFAHKPRSVAQSHAQFSDWRPAILGKMSGSSMAFKLHSSSAYEKSISTIAIS